MTELAVGPIIHPRMCVPHRAVMRYGEVNQEYVIHWQLFGEDGGDSYVSGVYTQDWCRAQQEFSKRIADNSGVKPVTMAYVFKWRQEKSNKGAVE